VPADFGSAAGLKIDRRRLLTYEKHREAFADCLRWAKRHRNLRKIKVSGEPTAVCLFGLNAY
jgi:hypothetical protein